MKYETIVLNTPSTMVKVISDKPSKKLTKEEIEQLEEYYFYCENHQKTVVVSNELVDFINQHDGQLCLKKGDRIIYRIKLD